MPKQDITIEIESEPDDALSSMRSLSDHLSEFGIRPYLSPDSISNLRSPNPDKLLLSAELSATASLVHVIIRWLEENRKKLIIHVGKERIVVGGDEGVNKLLDLVRDEIYRKGSKSIGISGTHGPGGSWDE